MKTQHHRSTTYIYAAHIYVYTYIFYALRISIWRMRFGHKCQKKKNNNKFRRAAFRKSGGGMVMAALPPLPFGDMFSCGFPSAFLMPQKMAL